MLNFARNSMSEVGPKKLLSAVRVLEKFGWIERLVVPMDWKFVEAISAFHAAVPAATHKFWASMETLRAFCKLCSSPQEWELVVVGAINICLGLRT